MRSASERAPLVAGGRRDDGHRGYGDGSDGYDGNDAGWSHSGRGHRARTLERRWLAALIALLGVVLAVAGRRHGERGTVDAFGGVGGGWAPSAPSERLPRSQSRKGVIAEPWEEERPKERRGEDSGGGNGIDLEMLNEQLSGSVWDFNDASPFATIRKSKEKGGAARREAQPLPALGQTSSSRRSDGKSDVAEGESRSNSASKSDTGDRSSSSSSKTSTIQSGLALSDDQIYDPAFVDDEYENGRRSGRELIKRFLDPPLLNSTWDTGRLRRLGRTLYLDGKPWLMRAVCYSPVPVGWDPDWFEPYGDFFTNDYAGIFERDLPLMAAAGVNTVRIYTLKFSKRHRQFFDLAHAYNISVMVGYDFEDGTKDFFNTEETMTLAQNKLRRLVRSAKHPAVVGWIVGNELNGPWNLYVCDSELAENFGVGGCQFGDSIEKLMKSVNMLCSVVRSENMLCGTALANVNLPRTKQHLVGRQLWGGLSWIKLADRYMDQLDFWGVNLYTRRYFSPMGIFQRFHIVSKRPFLITEFGVDAYSLNPQLEGLNGYETMGSEDEVSQADWLGTMVEDIERHATSCKAGCGIRFTSGGAIMAWVDEYWKGKAVTPVPTDDERIPTITRVCPSLKEYLHSPCGYMSPTQPDLYVSEEWFGLMAVKKKCSINKVDLLRPRAAFFMLKLLWKAGGSCTIFHDPALPRAYDPDVYPDCSMSMKNYHNRTMHLFMRAEAEAFHGIQLAPNQQTPIFAHFENFSAILTHPKGVINPVSTALQSTFLTCHHMSQINRKNSELCPGAPEVFTDVESFIAIETRNFQQPGDTSCPDKEAVDALKLEVELMTVIKAAFIVYFAVSLALRWKLTSRYLRDALVALSRSDFLIVKLFVRDSRDVSATHSRVERILTSPAKDSRSLRLGLESEPRDDRDAEKPSLTRRGPEPSGSTSIERNVERWRARISPVTDTFGELFGFQQSSEVGGSRENCARKISKQLWNYSVRQNAPKSNVDDWAIDQLHRKMFKTYRRYVRYTGFDATPRGANTLASNMDRANSDAKLAQLVLFELIHAESANLRFAPEFMAFVFNLMASAVTLNGSSVKPVSDAGLSFEPGDFVDMIIKPLYDLIVLHLRSTAPLHLRLGYDDINETFLDMNKVRIMLEPKADRGSSQYARFRAFMRTASSDKDSQSLKNVFRKTYREHLGWGTVFLNFHRLFALLVLLLHALVVIAFFGFEDVLKFSTAAFPCALIDIFIEARCLLFDRFELFHSRIESMGRLLLAMILSLLTFALFNGMVEWSTFAAVGFPYIVLMLANIFGYQITRANGFDRYFTEKVSSTTTPSQKRTYIVLWLLTLALKLSLDYVLMVHSLVAPTKAILQLDLYCWNYNFSGVDCDTYDYNELLPESIVEIIRLSRRYGFKTLMLVERWLPNVMLYFSNTFFYFVLMVGTGSALQHRRYVSTLADWSATVLTLPSAVASFGRKVIASEMPKEREPNKATALCAQAMSPTWLTFANAWNEIVKSIRKRDLMNDDETELLLFRTLSGDTSKSFFDGEYIVFPVMLSGSLFSNIGVQRNEKMRLDFSPAIVAQAHDMICYVFVAILGVVDAKDRVKFTELIQSLTDLISLSVSEHSRAITWLSYIRQAMLKMTSAFVEAKKSGQTSDTRQVRAHIEDVLEYIVADIAKDREREATVQMQTNSLIVRTCDNLKMILKLDRLDNSAAAHAAATSRDGSQVLQQLHLNLTTANPAGEPSSDEAKDVLRFFIASLSDVKMPNAVSVREMPMVSTMTPVYGEEVRTTLDTLTSAVDGESVTGFRFLVSMSPFSWDNMLERTRVHVNNSDYEHFFDRALLNKNTALSTFTPEEESLCEEAITWASCEGQTLYRTVRGFSSYADALRLLARLEGEPEDEIEVLVRMKYEHVICAQIYGVPGYTMRDDVEKLVEQYPHVKVNYVKHPSAESPGFENVLMERSMEGTCQITHRIALPGNPIIGEGKPENQNDGVIWLQGDYIQTIDMNQDAHLAEGLKLRNLLGLFNMNEEMTIVGFAEQLISGKQGSVANFAAVSETVFGTFLQRFMASPLAVRLHYGHPDLWDGTFVRTSGGLSKASKRLHLSEDVFGATNVVQRGGVVSFANFITCGKGREVSFDGNNQFNRKISTGNGMQLLSRDFHRMAKSMDVFRCLSFFSSSVGLFFSEFMLFTSMGAYVLCKLMIALLSIETYFNQGDAFDNVGFHQEVGLEILYPSQWMLQASLVMAWPGLLYGFVSGGLVNMIKRLYHDCTSGAFVYHMFIAKSRGAAIDSSVSSGQAAYRGTKRTMSMNASFVDLYTQYADSHILPAASIMVQTLLLTELSSFGSQYVFVMTTWHVWLACLFWIFSPWFFHPQTFKDGVPALNFMSWVFWLDLLKTENHSSRLAQGNWWDWHSLRMKANRGLSRRLKSEYVMFRVLPMPLVVLVASTATLRVDEMNSLPVVRSVVVITSGVAGLLLAVVYYMSTSQTFLWPQRIVAVASRMRLVKTEIQQHMLVLVYKMSVRVSLFMFHQRLCARLFKSTLDVNLRVNKVAFAMTAYFMIGFVVGVTGVISDNAPRFVRQMLRALRGFSDFLYKDTDEMIGILLHCTLGICSLAPISYIHAKLLFNRAYASVLAVEMRRKTLVTNMNRAVSTSTIQTWLRSSRIFIRKVLGLQNNVTKFARPAPSTIPDLDEKLSHVSEVVSENARETEIKRRLEPIATHLADLFGFQKSATDSTFTESAVEVPSNLWNSVEALTRWLSNLISQKSDVIDYSVDYVDRHWKDVVGELHSHLFQNYNNWAAYTGMGDAVALVAKKNKDAGSDSLPLSAFMSSNEELWTRGRREELEEVELNARLHHLCLWFLLYGESANLRHMSEVLCFLFHAASCAVMLEHRAPSEGEQILVKPVSDEVMPYGEKDFLRSVVTPIYLFLQHEIAARTEAPVSERVMYDDVNEFFWRYERMSRILPPDTQGERPEDDADFVGVPETMASLPRESRMYEHLRSVLQRASNHPEGPAGGLRSTFFKTHRESSGWLSMYVNFNSIIVFHAVAFHVTTAIVFAHGWDWSYISTSMLTHALLKFVCEISILKFRNLQQESLGDWLVTMTRAGMYLTVPVFYALEISIRGDGNTSYYEGLAAVYALANSGMMSSMLNQSPYIGSATQMATPIRERIVYTLFWIVVLGTKVTFGYYLLILPLREAVNALKKGDLCWNKESDEYTSCINLEGDALVQALKFEPKETYFTQVKKDEDDYEDDLQLSYYEPIPERRRSLLESHASHHHRADPEEFDPYNGRYRQAHVTAPPSSNLGTPLSPLVSDVFESASSFVRRASGAEKLRLPALGYIGEEIEGQLPEAYYDVHASQFLMSVLVVTRMLPTVATYFCDTFLWYTCYSSLFTIFLQWNGKVSHAQVWSTFLRDFKSIPESFCKKIINRSWPKPTVMGASVDDADSLGVSNDFALDGSDADKAMRERLLDDAVALTVEDAPYSADVSVKDAIIDPVDFSVQALDIKWQHLSRGWNEIVDSLRARDHITNKESNDLKFVFLKGRDVEQIFDAPEYIIFPPMLTSSVFSRANFDTGSMSQYPFFETTLIQTKDLLCVLMTEVLRVVSPGDMRLLMHVITDIAAIEGEHMQHRRRDDVQGYVQLRDAIVKLLLTLQAMGSSTEATPIIEDEDDQDDAASESDSDDEETQLRLLGDTAGAERAKVRREQRQKRRQAKAMRDKEKQRHQQMVEAINLEMKFGCTGFIPKQTRKKLKEKSGIMRGCFVVQENWDDQPEEGGDAGAGETRKRWKRGRRKLIKWSSIQTDADIEAQSITLAEALHEILLAVRKLCSFAMEHDKKWSSLHNKRKYRVSQLYSQLLEMVRIDALRDHEHVRVVSASATLPTNRKIVDSLLGSMNNMNPGGEPRNPEARRQLMFFSNSLNFTNLKAPCRLKNMRSWTAFTPYYAEEVSYSKQELTRPLEDQKTLLSLIQATYPDEYENFKERVGAIAEDDSSILEKHWEELRVWTSDHTQSLSRCIRGICHYGTALRFLARAEGYDEDQVEVIVREKFEYLVSCQVYGRMLSAPEGSPDRQKAEDINQLILRHPELRVCFVQMPSEKADSYASCLVSCDALSKTLSIACKVELPGNPIVGEGKPENQNHAVIFSRGAYLQTLDMNQDGYLGEALKMRNLLDVFVEDVVLVGFPEVIFSETTGAVAQFAAISEFIFQTFQRFMTWPLMVRFHYGHPDVWDKAFTMTNGGVSKASKIIHVAEDFFGGVNAIVRGGRVLFEEFIEVGKGRDMGFTSVNGFEQKISGSAGTISMSRDIYRLHRSMDFFRIMSMYFSGPGFFISVMQTAWCVYLYILVHASLAIADLEIYRVYRYFKMTETQTTLSLSKEEGGYYNSIYAIQLGLLTVLPLFLKMIMDRGFRDGVEYTINSLLRGSWAFNIFAMTTKGYNYMVGLLFGQAQYIATERGYVLQNANMVVLYGLYAKSHLYFGMEVLFLLILFHVNTVLPKAILYSWSVWFFGVCVVIAPWWFSPQSTNLYWMQNSWSDWRSWLDGTFDKPKVAHGSWSAWHKAMNANYRNRIGGFSKLGILWMSGFGRFILFLVIVGSLHGSALYSGLSQLQQFQVNVDRMMLATGLMAFTATLYAMALSSDVFSRERWLEFPNQLWKISVYRGLVRFGTFMVWNGLYFFALHQEGGSNTLERTWFMTTLGACCAISIVVEAWLLLSDKTVTSFGESMLTKGEESAFWRRAFVYRTRALLSHARGIADFWFKELDKLMGFMIFTILTLLSLLPVATMQTVLIWNETFSDILTNKIKVQDTVTSILD